MSIYYTHGENLNIYRYYIFIITIICTQNFLSNHAGSKEMIKQEVRLETIYVCIFFQIIGNGLTKERAKLFISQDSVLPEWHQPAEQTFSGEDLPGHTLTVLRFLGTSDKVVGTLSSPPPGWGTQGLSCSLQG